MMKTLVSRVIVSAGLTLAPAIALAQTADASRAAEASAVRLLQRLGALDA